MKVIALTHDAVTVEETKEKVQKALRSGFESFVGVPDLSWVKRVTLEALESLVIPPTTTYWTSKHRKFQIQQFARHRRACASTGGIVYYNFDGGEFTFYRDVALITDGIEHGEPGLDGVVWVRSR